MTLQLLAHPFSSYCWKVLIPLWENGTAFEYRKLGPEDPHNGEELARRWPIGRFPVLIDGDTQVVEASAIIEYLDVVHPGPTRLIPADARTAVEVRMMDRIFDNYVSTPLQTIVFDAIRPPEHRDPYGVTQAREILGKAYAWLDAHMTGRTWAATDAFTLADCAAAPSLFYADWVEPLGDRHPALAAYRARLLARPCIARAVDEARPYREYFPLGGPDRD